MIASAIAVFKRLWNDDSGVVLALTVIVLLPLFLLASSVYAVGENIRRRIELQNAVDAAAYSAANVQAETITRIALLNRAMAWTYVMMCRRQMDYITDKWLCAVIEEYEDTAGQGQRFYNSLSNTCCKRFWVGSERHNNEVWVNGNWFPIQELIDAKRNFDPWRKSLRKEIKNDWDIIQSLNELEVDLILNMPKRIEHVVRNIILPGNMGDSIKISNDRLLNEINLPDKEFDRYCAIYQETKTLLSSTGKRGSGLFSLQDEEEKFLSGASASSDSLGRGHNTWFLPQPGNFPWEGIREYVQGEQFLVARWNVRAEGYRDRDCLFPAHWGVKEPGEAGCGGILPNGKSHSNGPPSQYEKLGMELWDKFFTTYKAEPQKLNIDFFEKGGSVVIAAARPIGNPFWFMTRGTQNEGGSIYSLFSADEFGENQRPRFMWSIAAARAGYRDHGRPGGPGGYNPTIDSYQILTDPERSWQENKKDWQSGGWPRFSSQNLILTDWDAVLLPIAHAWSKRSAAWIGSPRRGIGGKQEGGRWLNKEGNADEILKFFWEEAEWHNNIRIIKGATNAKPVKGLRNIAAADPPGKADADGAIRFDEQEVNDWIWH